MPLMIDRALEYAQVLRADVIKVNDDEVGNLRELREVAVVINVAVSQTSCEGSVLASTLIPCIFRLALTFF
jgi:hypothetical protein